MVKLHKGKVKHDLPFPQKIISNNSQFQTFLTYLRLKTDHKRHQFYPCKNSTYTKMIKLAHRVLTYLPVLSIWSIEA